MFAIILCFQAVRLLSAVNWGFSTRAPLDTPECGFDDEFCIPEPSGQFDFNTKRTWDEVASFT